MLISFGRSHLSNTGLIFCLTKGLVKYSVITPNIKNLSNLSFRSFWRSGHILRDLNPLSGDLYTVRQNNLVSFT